MKYSALLVFTLSLVCIYVIDSLFTGAVENILYLLYIACLTVDRMNEAGNKLEGEKDNASD